MIDSDLKNKILKESFGYSSFRPAQAEIIDALTAGRDVLALLPTGAGKSLCYQIPAMMLSGKTIVISPLISLMKDQVETLNTAGVPAVYINSSLPANLYYKAIEYAASDKCKIIYIAPERLTNEAFISFAASKNISALVIDEAHCVSQWGHDFRPSYLGIKDFVSLLPVRPALAAFTATATLRVREDIERSLELQNAFSISTGFDRPNLFFIVQKPFDRTKAVLDYLKKRQGKNEKLEASGIIYCATRRTVESLCAELINWGYSATRYHAGLDDNERSANQEHFIYDRKNIMIATNAFGMGIDKPNVSFVIHYNMPKNIESYYQEAGRAGRDGSPADCILLYNSKDVQTNEYLIKHQTEEDGPQKKQIIAHNLELLKFMTFYASATDCLRARLLKYFNDNAPNYCGACSNCETRFEEHDITLEAQKIISCVLRLKQRKRKLGKMMVINILRGSRNQKINQDAYNTLSTYGIMADVSEQRCREIIDYLVIQGYLSVSTGDYPTLDVTEKAAELINEKKPLSMMLAKEGVAFVTTVKHKASEDEILFEKLKELRINIAHAAGLPAYVVFTDSTLHAMCRLLPANLKQFLEVPGVGEFKAQNYSEAFLDCITKHLGESEKIL